MSDQGGVAGIEALEPKHDPEYTLDAGDVVHVEPDPTPSEGQEGDEQDAHDKDRRLSDPQGKLRGKTAGPSIKGHGGGGGGSSRPSGGPKKDESDSDKKPDDGSGESQAGTAEQPSNSSGAAKAQPEAPKKAKGKLRGKAAPTASKGGAKGGSGLPGGAKT